MPRPPCMVLRCTGHRSDPHHQVNAAGPEQQPHPAPVCAEHWQRIDDGEQWLWVPGRHLKGVGSDLSEGRVLMGDELAGYGLVVDADGRMTNSEVFSPDLADGQAMTLAIDGRVFGTCQHVSIELALTPETAQHLQEALRFFRT